MELYNEGDNVLIRYHKLPSTRNVKGSSFGVIGEPPTPKHYRSMLLITLHGPLVRPYCWRHEILMSSDMEKPSCCSTRSFIPTDWRSHCWKVLWSLPEVKLPSVSPSQECCERQQWPASPMHLLAQVLWQWPNSFWLGVRTVLWSGTHTQHC